MEVCGSRFTPMEVNGSYHESAWVFALSVGAEASINCTSTNTCRGSFHELPNTPTYF